MKNCNSQKNIPTNYFKKLQMRTAGEKLKQNELKIQEELRVKMGFL